MKNLKLFKSGFCEKLKLLLIPIGLLIGSFTVQVWAWYSHNNNSHIYFNDYNSKWVSNPSSNGIAFLMGRDQTYGGQGIGSQAYRMAHIEHTNLWYCYVAAWGSDGSEQSQYEYVAFRFASGTTGWNDWQGGWDNRVTGRAQYGSNTKYSMTRNDNITGRSQYYCPSSSSSNTGYSDINNGLRKYTAYLRVNFDEEGDGTYDGMVEGSGDWSHGVSFDYTGTYMKDEGSSAQSTIYDLNKNCWSDGGTKWGYTDIPITGEVTFLLKSIDTGFEIAGWAYSSSADSPDYTANKNNPTFQVLGSESFYVAMIRRKSYTITLNDNGGSGGSGSKTVRYDRSVNMTTNVTKPSKNGYTFKGYFTNSNGSGTQVIDQNGAWIKNVSEYTGTDGSSNPKWVRDEGVTLYAKWEQTINLDKNGSDGSNTTALAVYNAAGPFAPAATQTYTDHTLVDYRTSGGTSVLTTTGAFTSSSISSYVTDGKWTKASATTLYAHWKVDAPSSITCTDNVVTISVPTDATVHYTMNGSTPTSSSPTYDPENKPVIASSGITVKAIAIQSGCTNSNVTSQAVTYTPVYTVGFTNPNVNKVSGETSVLQNKAYTATFTAQTGYNLPATVSVTIGGTPKTLTTDYTWSISAGTGTLSILANKITGNVAITVPGVAKTYSITLDDNGEYDSNGSATATYNNTTLTVISAPTRTGYHVSGYYTSDGSLYIADASGSLQAGKSGYTDGSSRWTKDAGATLYAHWEANTHSLSWDANGGDALTGEYTTGTTAYGTTIVKPNTPTQSGYVFKGWAESAGGDVVSVPATMPDADKTYYAQWLSSDDVSGCWEGETYNCGGIPNFATPKPGATTWSSATWGGGTPTLETEVVIPADMEITVDGTAFAKDVVLASTAKLNISSGAALIVANTVNKAGGSTSASDLDLRAGTSVTGNAALIWGKEGTTPGDASVGFYSKSHGQAGSSASVNQYIGVPVVTNTSAFGDAWVCHIKYEGNIAVWELHEGTMQPWVGYDLILNTTESGGSCIMSGTLENNSDKPLNLVYQGNRTENLIANSWPAPIKISAFQTSDFTNAEATIYIFNATSPDAQAKDETMHMGSYSAYTAGTATEVIPSMQSFSVVATGASPSINLNYKRLVYDPAVTSFTNKPNYAPKRTAVNEMTSLKINICDAQGWGDELKLFENSTDFSYEFEPGYDAHRLDGSSKAPHLYGLADDGSELAINCVPTFDNLPVGFKASAKDKEYTMSFKYDGEDELVLKDLKNNIETLINNGSRYTFTSTSTDDDLRFVVIKKTSQIATKVENTTSNEETKVQKILHNGLLYIVRDGRIYNAEGALVK